MQEMKCMDTKELRILPMSSADLPEVLRLEQENFGRMAWTERDFRSAMTSGYDAPLVLHRSSEDTASGSRDTYIAAYAVLRILAPEAEIENICVRADDRRRGIGACLMREMLNMAAKNGASRIFLEVRAHNEPAKALYRKMGFSDAYIRKAYYQSPTDDAIIMMKEIEYA